ncbi:MAG TPA: hypothetical protein PLX08_04660 [Bacteroidales bacterium]|jgi:tetratricopeptide (TPR) repeat protein|nr:hypothetical protein [Bacteroidales bacterium]
MIVALAEYEKAAFPDPQNADAWQNKAGLLANNRFDEAISSYDKALTDLGKAIYTNPHFRSYTI